MGVPLGWSGWFCWADGFSGRLTAPNSPLRAFGRSGQVGGASGHGSRGSSDDPWRVVRLGSRMRHVKARTVQAAFEDRHCFARAPPPAGPGDGYRVAGIQPSEPPIEMGDCWRRSRSATACSYDCRSVANHQVRVEEVGRKPNDLAISAERPALERISSASPAFSDPADIGLLVIDVGRTPRVGLRDAGVVEGVLELMSAHRPQRETSGTQHHCADVAPGVHRPHDRLPSMSSGPLEPHAVRDVAGVHTVPVRADSATAAAPLHVEARGANSSAERPSATRPSSRSAGAPYAETRAWGGRLVARSVDRRSPRHPDDQRGAGYGRAPLLTIGSYPPAASQVDLADGRRMNFASRLGGSCSEIRSTNVDQGGGSFRWFISCRMMHAPDAARSRPWRSLVTAFLRRRPSRT